VTHQVTTRQRATRQWRKVLSEKRTPVRAVTRALCYSLSVHRDAVASETISHRAPQKIKGVQVDTNKSLKPRVNRTPKPTDPVRGEKVLLSRNVQPEEPDPVLHE
jgi:hypothetical protein